MPKLLMPDQNASFWSGSISLTTLNDFTHQIESQKGADRKV